MTKMELRPYLDSDESFSFKLFREFQGEYIQLPEKEGSLKEKVLWQQFKLLQADVSGDRNLNNIILYENEPVGLLFLKYDNVYIEVVSIMILPLYRNRGIGTYFLNKVKEESEVNKKGLRLKVAWYNELAIKLYKTLGFEIVENYDAYIVMQFKSKEYIGGCIND